MLSQCQSCGENYPNWIIKYQELDLWECPICNSLSYLAASPVESENLYQKKYFSGGEYLNYEGERRIHERNFAKKWNLIRPILPPHPRIFELGCAYGYFIKHALNQGAQVFGIDVSQDAIDEATRNFGDHFGASSERPSFEFNSLIAWDVWEHLPHPFLTFSDHAKFLPTGGLFAMTTVDSTSLVARIRGRHWRQIHPPTHLHYPTRKGLRIATERMNLKVMRHESFGPARSWRTYLSALGIEKGSLERGPSINLGDIQLLICSKS